MTVSVQLMANNNNSSPKIGTGGFMNPERILGEIGIEPGMLIADFGCGAGYFAIPMAKIVGNDGKIYALDVLKTALESVKSRAKAEGIFNIEAIWSNLEIEGASKLEDGSVDLALLANILFQSQKKSDIIKEAKRILKKQGRIVVIDWIPNKRSPLIPIEGYPISQESIKEIVLKEGFLFEREFGVDNYHYGLIFVKK